MKLHEAIEILLQKNGKPMTTSEIAFELNKNKWYQKKDGSEIQPFQIHRRTKNYLQLFSRKGSTVSLIGQKNIKVSTPIISTEKSKTKVTEILKSLVLLEKVLMNEKEFKNASDIDSLIPPCSGLYCIRIRNYKALPELFARELEERKHNIIYIGIASQNLKKRFLNQELRANGHGTFFRSIGAVLGFKPPKGSLKNKTNKKNYKFSTSDESKIIEWINKNLIVNWIEFNGNFESIETNLIQKYLPLINIAKNPLSVKELSDLRAECVKIANS